MTREEADIVVSYIEKLEERANHQAVVEAMAADGYREREVDKALKALGRVAGRDCGFT